MLTKGDKAPEFVLKNQRGEDISLADLKGRTIVLYFYPKDDTPGCTKEACGFRDLSSDFAEFNATILGVSPDSSKSHQKFIDKYQLPFDLLSDESKEMLIQYGVWKEKSMYGKKYMGVVRTTLVIDAEGKIAEIFPKVKVDQHPDAVLEVVRKIAG
jgi:peroxiredoxin Q/BCP